MSLTSIFCHCLVSKRTHKHFSSGSWIFCAFIPQNCCEICHKITFLLWVANLRGAVMTCLEWLSLCMSSSIFLPDAKQIVIDLITTVFEFIKPYFKLSPFLSDLSDQWYSNTIVSHHIPFCCIYLSLARNTVWRDRFYVCIMACFSI